MKALMLIGVAGLLVLGGCGDAVTAGGGDGSETDGGAGGAPGAPDAPDGNWGGPYDTAGLDVVLCSQVEAHKIGDLAECADGAHAVCAGIAGADGVVGCALVHTTTNHLVSCVASCP